MLSFAAPGLLWLVPAVPLLAWLWHRRPAPALRFPDLSLADGLPRRRAAVARWAATLGRAGGLLLLVFAAAGPRTPDLRTRLPADGIAVALVIDASGSMAAPDFPTAGPPTSRLDAAKQTFRLFAVGGTGPDNTPFDGRPTDQIALVTFAAWPQTECPLTLNHSVLLKLLDDIIPRIGAEAGTNIGDAMAEALNRLRAAGDRRKVLVLLSDGEHNTGGEGTDAPLRPRQAAQLAANLGVPVYAIDCGGEPSGDPDAMQQRADGKAVLDTVARMTGGKSFSAASAGELQAVVKEIDALERAPATSYQYRRYHEHAAGCGLAAAGLFGLLTLLEATRWRRTP